jgi:hypothetical protein
VQYDTVRICLLLGSQDQFLGVGTANDLLAMVLVLPGPGSPQFRGAIRKGTLDGEDPAGAA